MTIYTVAFIILNFTSFYFTARFTSFMIISNYD